MTEFGPIVLATRLAQARRVIEVLVERGADTTADGRKLKKLASELEAQLLERCPREETQVYDVGMEQVVVVAKHNLGGYDYGSVRWVRVSRL